MASDLRSAEAAARDLLGDLQWESWRDGVPDDRVAALERAAQHLGAAAQSLFRSRDSDNAEIAADSLLGLLRIIVVVVVLVLVSVTPITFAVAVLASGIVMACVEAAGAPFLLRSRIRRHWLAGSTGKRIQHLLAMIDTVRATTAVPDERIFNHVDDHVAAAGALLRALCTD